MKQMLDLGIKRLNFAMQLCEVQRKHVLYFLFEHPAGAYSWSVNAVQKMVKQVDVNTYEGDMCQYDMKQLIKGEEMFVKKPSRFMANSPCVGK